MSHSIRSEGLHEGLKSLDRIVRKQQKKLSEAARAAGKRVTVARSTKETKARLARLHGEVTGAEEQFVHIHWLQERFPEAKYENVTGLCNLADSTGIEEQDYSLNPGRYVGVVVEEDGKTEDEFVAEVLALDEQILDLSEAARELEGTISANLRELVGEA